METLLEEEPEALCLARQATMKYPAFQLISESCVNRASVTECVGFVRLSASYAIAELHPWQLPATCVPSLLTANCCCQLLLPTTINPITFVLWLLWLYSDHKVFQHPQRPQLTCDINATRNGKRSTAARYKSQQAPAEASPITIVIIYLL